MGQPRGEYDLSGRFMKPGSSAGSLAWSLSQAKKPLPQRKSHGTAVARERKSRSQKRQLPPLKFRRPPSVKGPSEPRFPQAVGWLCIDCTLARRSKTRDPLALLQEIRSTSSLTGGKTSKQTHSKYLVRVLVLSPAEIAGPRRLPESGREVAFHDVLIFGDQG